MIEFNDLDNMDIDFEQQFFTMAIINGDNDLLK